MTDDRGAMSRHGQRAAAAPGEEIAVPAGRINHARGRCHHITTPRIEEEIMRESTARPTLRRARANPATASRRPSHQ